MATHTSALKSIAGSFQKLLACVNDIVVYHERRSKGSRVQIAQELVGVYRGDTIRSREKLIQLKELIQEKANRAAKSELARKMRVAKGFYTLEMAPPSSSSEMQRLNEELKMLKEFMKPEIIKMLTVKQALLLFLVGMEVGLWFYLGETIGKFHIVGYKVNP